ncbi:PREDICTED: LOW QUALITY PROTEIN: tenascin-X, partial [Myotis davidii]|uniref:LOW QUALITY PROTEIN: tenascin-X n=1 Tax=Myotis davidii TaxID=225400 RepID=UPI000767CF96
MMPAQCSRASSLALLLLLGAVRAGPFSPRSNMTLPAPRPPPQPGGRTAEPRGGNPSSQLYEHIVEGGEKQVVFTHRINLPPSAGCGCPPGTEPPVPASEVQALRVRLEILEELVKGLKEQCTAGCCPAAAQAGTGQTDVRSLCSLHGVFDLNRCACSCEPGWGGPTCSDPTDSRVSPSSPPSASGSCPDDCNDQGRCVRGRCVCFSGYTGPSCGWLVMGWIPLCVEGFRGPDCAIQTCPGDCLGRGECREGSCVCLEGYAGEDCGEEVPAIEGMRMHLLEETTVRTEWTRAPGPVDAYEIQFIPTPEGASPPFTARVPSSASAYDQRGLAPGQEYQVTVRALRGTNWGPPASKTITTMIDGPQDLRVVAVTPTTLELGWLRPQAEVDRFVVSYVSAGNQRVRLEVPAEADGTLLTDLMPGVEYVVTVTAERGRAVSYPASVRANTGSSPSGLLGATDEPPPSGPSTTQGAQAPGLQQRPQELGELRVLGRDETGRLRVAWMAQPDTFAHFQLRLRVPNGPGSHDQLLPGDVRQALLPPPPPGASYELSLRGVPPEGEPSAPLIYQGIMDSDGEKPGKPLAPPRLGELTVTDVTSSSLLLHWTVPEGEFDSFVIQYKDRDQPRVVPVEGPQRSALITNLDVGRKYKFLLYGFVGRKRHGPLAAEAKILPRSDPSPETLPRLGTLWVTEPTPHSLRLSWTVPEGHFDSFVVQYRDRDGRPQVVPVEGPERSITVSPLDADHKYRFTLFGVANKKRHGPLSAEGTTAPERTEEPRPEPLEQPLLGELTVTGATRDALRLSWTVARGRFSSFVIQYKDAQGQPRTVPVKGEESAATIGGLEPGRKYKMTLYGLHGRQRVGPVSVVATTAPDYEAVTTQVPPTTTPEPPVKPLLGELTVTGSSPDSLSLSWTVPQGQFDHFLVQYKNGDGQPKAVRVPGHEDGVTISGLEPDHKYKMHLYGFHDGQRQGPASVTGVTAPAPGAAPAATEPPSGPRLGELTVTGVTPRSVGLAWTVPEGQFDSFVVQYENSDGQLQVVPVAADQREATVPGLEPARGYRMLVYGLHSGQRLGPLSVGAVTAPLPPAPATESPQEPRLGELTVTDVTPSSVGLSWTVPAGEFDSFVVQYKDRDGQPRVVPVAADQLAVTVPGLEPDRKYRFLLFGIQEGKRHSSVSVEAKTGAHGDASPQAPPRLGELRVTDPTPDSLRLSWTVPEGHFDSFVVQFKDRDGPRMVPVGGHERSVTITPLDSGRTYRFLLYGLLGKRRHGPLSADGTTEAQGAASVAGTKRPPKPRLGAELQVTSVTPDSVGLAWTVPEGQFDSFLVQYKDREGRPQVLPVEGGLREARVWGLDAARRYKLLLYGLHQGRRVGPLSAFAVTGECDCRTDCPASLQDKDRDGRPQVVRVGGEESEVTVRGLEPGRKYKMHLYGLHGGRRVGPASTLGLTAAEEETPSPAEPSTEAPEPPEEPLLGELTVTGSSPDSLSLSWTVPRGHFDAFTVQYKDRDGRPQVVRVGGEESEVTVRGLEPGRKYKMHLYGLHGGRRVGPASTLGLTEPSTEAPQPPEEPLLGELTVTGSSPDSLSLSWTVPRGHFDAFTVQYKDRDGRPQVVRVGGEESEVTVRGLEPGRKYKMHLYAAQEVVEETPSSTEPSTEAPQPPEEPLLGELTVTGSSPDSLSLSWTVPRGHFDAFTVQYKDRDGRPQVVRVGGEESEVTVRGLEPGRKYKMHLYGLHGGRRVGPASTLGLTAPKAEPPAGPPVKPRLGELTVTGSSPDSLSLSWTVPQGQFDHFLVQYKNGDGQPKAVRVPGHEDGVTISGLEPDHKYKMHLYGFHDGQRQGPASVTGVTGCLPRGRRVGPASTLGLTATLPSEPPVAPRLEELAVAAVTSDSVLLSWTVAQGPFDSFLVQYRDEQGQPQAVPVGGDLREVTVSGLAPARKYKFLLFGVQGAKRHGPLSADAKTLPDTQPPRLGELTVTGVTPDSVGLAWTVPQGKFDSFKVQYKDRHGQSRVVPVAADQREATVGGLEPHRKYRFLLYGLAGGRQLGPVPPEGTTAPEEDTPAPWQVATGAPDTPGGPRLGELAVTDSTPDSLHLAWTVARGPFDSFVVQYWDADGTLGPSTAYKFFLYGLHEGKRLGPVSMEGTTGSAPAGQTPGGPGPRLSQLSVTDVTTSSLRLNWEAPPGAFDSFLLRYGVPSASTPGPHPRPPLQREVTVPGTQLSAVLRDLRPGTLYSLTLYGFPGPHQADSVQGQARHISPSVLESPRDLQFSDIGETSAKVSWTPPPSRADSFKVSYQLVDGGEPQSVLVGGRARTQQLGGLVPGAHYEVTVVSVRGFEESEPLTGFLTTVPDGPTQLRALNLTEGTATVDYPLQGLELHTNYTATVHGLRGPNLTSPASIVFTTGLEGPRDLEAKEVTPRTALLTWTEPQVLPTGYLLTYDTPDGQTQEILLPGSVTSHQLLVLNKQRKGARMSTTYRAWLRAMWGEALTPPMSTSFTTGGLQVPFPRDCGEEMQNGAGTSRTTTIFLNGNRARPLDVFCDMETDGGGWLVFQRRMDGRTDFWRDWEDYAHGFGNISGEFWLGNEALHSLTSHGDYSMRVDLRAGGEMAFAQYDSFRVDSAADYYRLHLEGYHGTAGDSMSYHSGSVFSARDRDPNNLLISCAVSYRGAWWYRNCHYANLNGLYGSTVDHQGVSWYHWKGFEFSVPFTEMKLRPRGYRAP